jgi:hypothetical protein
MVSLAKDVRHFNIVDDSGFLALIDPDAYRSFVAEDWTYPEIMQHFTQEMQERHALIWRTESENMWRVLVQFHPATGVGAPEFVGPIGATHGRLLLTSYESLTMAAQFADVTLPEPHEQDQLIMLAPSMYRCRIMRTGVAAEDESEQAHWIIEMLPDGHDLPVWREVA